jgi:hypothetical protein
MAYRATPNTVTGYSPYYLLHGREMTLPNSDNLKVKISTENPDQNSRLKNFQSSLKLAYQQVARANKKSYLNNKFWYDRKAKQRKFEVNDFVYLYSPAMKPGLSRKFRKQWTGLYRITRKISDVNYEIMDQNKKSQNVHVNRLKIAHNTGLWKAKQHRNSTKKTREKMKKLLDEEEEDEFRIGSLPLQIPNYNDRTESETPLVQTPYTPDTVQQMVETPFLKRDDQNYSPHEPPDPVKKCNPREQNPALRG